MSPRSVDEFLGALEDCTAVDTLFSVFRDEIEREGFQNVVFVRQDRAKIIEIPYLSVADRALETYLEQNLAETDPMVRLVSHRSPAFTWDEMLQRCESKAERDTLGICREIGCTGGYAMPFYGPHGVSDVFDITYREPRAFNPARKKLLSMKTYAAWLRFLELDSSAMAQQHLQTSDDALAKAFPAHAHHKDGLEKIAADECRALVICDLAARRYKAGLTELNDSLKTTLGDALFHRLQSRGLLLDVPDDDHMRYYYEPSPVAVAHIRRCRHAIDVKHDAWRLHARANERPSDWF